MTPTHPSEKPLADTLDTGPRTWVAIGDSFTAGTGDDRAHGGWVRRTGNELIAAELLDTYECLAHRGDDIATVIKEQLPKLDGSARLVSAIGGANDVLQRRCNLRTLLVQVDLLLDQSTACVPLVLTTTCPDFFAHRGRSSPRLTARVDALNEHVRRREQAAAGRLLVVDAHRILSDPALWAPDAIHPNPDGHRRLAAMATELCLRSLTLQQLPRRDP